MSKPYQLELFLSYETAEVIHNALRNAKKTLEAKDDWFLSLATPLTIQQLDAAIRIMEQPASKVSP